MPHPPSPSDQLASGSSPRRRTWLPLVAGLLIVLGFAGLLLQRHRANLQLLAAKSAEAERKQRELEDLAASVQLTPGIDPQKGAAVASDLADLLAQNQMRQRRLTEILDRIGVAVKDGVEMRSLRLGKGRLSLAGCAAGKPVVEALVGALTGLPYLEPGPVPVPAVPGNPCTDPALPESFDLLWSIREAGTPANSPVQDPNHP